MRARRGFTLPGTETVDFLGLLMSRCTEARAAVVAIVSARVDGATLFRAEPNQPRMEAEVG